jgi:hypothetical protein
LDLTIDAADLQDALRRLDKAIAKHGTQLAFAKAHGLSHTIVSQVVRRRIDPPPQVLEALGLVRVVRYVTILGKKRADDD